MSKLGLDEDDQNELWSTKAYLVQPALAATAELGIVKRKQFETQTYTYLNRNEPLKKCSAFKYLVQPSVALIEGL